MEQSITLNGVELAFDIFDLKTAEHYEAAMNRMSETVKELQREEASLSFAENVRRQCGAIIGCLDELFGEGSAVRVLGTESNLRACLSAFGELVTGIERQKKEIGEIAQTVKQNLKAAGHESADR